MDSSVSTKYAKRLHTSAKRAKEATSVHAKVVRICVKISAGSSARGLGAWGEASVAGGAGSIRSPEKSSTSCLSEGEKPLLPCREGWPVPGTVTAALDGFVLLALGFTKDDGGKCFFLYAS